MKKLIASLLVVLTTALFSIALAAPSQAASKCSVFYNRQVCAVTTSTAGSSFVVGYVDSIYNKRNYAISGSCTSTTSKTVSHKVDYSVTGEVKGLIFSSMSATLGGGISKSKTTGYTTSSTFKVPAKSEVVCKRGMVTKKAKGYTKTVAYSAGKGTTTKKYWSSSAPARPQWRIE